MSQHLKDYESIDRYLNDRMNKEEQAAFEDQLEQDPDLKAEVEAHRKLTIGLENLGTRQQRQQLQQTKKVLDDIRASTDVAFDHQHGAKKAGRSKVLNRLLSSYASKITVIVLFLATIGVGAFYFLNSNQPSPTELYQSHYTTPPNTLALDMRSGDQSRSKALNPVFKAYEKGKFQQALASANDYLADHPNDKEVQFYRGIMHLELDHYPKAVNDFSAATSLKGKTGRKARWYLAMAYLAQKQPGKAETVLKKLANQPPSVYQDKAKKLLAQLRP